MTNSQRAMFKAKDRLGMLSVSALEELTQMMGEIVEIFESEGESDKANMMRLVYQGLIAEKASRK